MPVTSRHNGILPGDHISRLTLQHRTLRMRLIYVTGAATDKLRASLFLNLLHSQTSMFAPTSPANSVRLHPQVLLTVYACTHKPCSSSQSQPHGIGCHTVSVCDTVKCTVSVCRTVKCSVSV